MALNPVSITREVHEAPRQGNGMFFQGDVLERLRALTPEYEGKIKLIYMDPPFVTGSRFFMRCKAGTEGWQHSAANLVLPSYTDYSDMSAFLAMMREVLTLCRQLLTEDGMIFVHLDYRANAHVRLLMDELFGEKQFMNEIIWAYQSGGRSKRHFSRKHDNILLYSKTDRPDFNIEAVMEPSAQPRANHMRRHVDPDGRVYRSIKVGGRVYTYYDDAPVAPSDVWADLNHLQQRDPERTGYDNQKPLSLLWRIVRCASRAGDWVLDPFAGSGTTLLAAAKGDRHFIGIDACALTPNIIRRRLSGYPYALTLPEAHDFAPHCDAQAHVGIGFYEVVLKDWQAPLNDLPEGLAPLDAVDGWSVGYLRDGTYHVMDEAFRSGRNPELKRTLNVPVYGGTLAVAIYDVRGQTYSYALNAEGAEA